MTKGRKTLFSERLKANGLSAELDNWFKELAAHMGITTSALKRIALEAYRQNYNQEKPLVPEGAVEIPSVTVEVDGPNVTVEEVASGEVVE